MVDADLNLGIRRFVAFALDGEVDESRIAEYFVPESFGRDSVAEAAPDVFVLGAEMHLTIEAHLVERRMLKKRKRSKNQVPERLGMSGVIRCRRNSIVRNLDLQPIRFELRDLRANDLNLRMSDSSCLIRVCDANQAG